MIAASYWSLLAPAIEIAEESGIYGRFAFLPAAIGFGLGAAALFATESVLPMIEKWFGKPENMSKKNDDLYDSRVAAGPDPMASYGVHAGGKPNSFRRVLLLVIAITLHNLPEGMAVGVGFGSIGHSPSATFSNAVSLTIGIGALHILAGFHAAKPASNTIQPHAMITLGLQNFPEGLAVSMPLRREGMSAWKAFMWGQLSGLVEPIGGVRMITT